MNEVDAAEKILDTMLSKLGFEVEYERTSSDDGPCLNILTEEGAHLIGKNGDRLEDLQYLMNRVLNRHYPEASRVKVDCDHYRAKQEKDLIETARDLANQVVADGKVRKLQPLNAYYRRIAHNAMADIEGVKTSSPKASSRYKRIHIEKV